MQFHVDKITAINFYQQITIHGLQMQVLILLEFPQFYPQDPDFMSITVNNFQKIPKI